MYRVNIQKGLTLIETLVASAIFLVVAIAITQMYMSFMRFSTSIRNKTVLTEVISEQFEFIRSLKYGDVGIISGIPSGVVPPTQTIIRNGVTFALTTTIRNIDNPADGTLGGTPNDLSPADNKLVEIEGVCIGCPIPVTITYTSLIAPKNLETENGNGVLAIKAIDASGHPIDDAAVNIVNSGINPAVNISDVTDATGTLLIVDAPPSIQQYQITVTKNGYSSEQTFAPGTPSNPDPLKPHLTVSANKISQATFAIDRLSTLNIVTQSEQCVPIGNVSGTLTGTKLIGNPNVIKNTKPFTTAGSGGTTLGTVEWDTYALSIAGSLYSIAGTNPMLPLTVAPNTTYPFTVTLKPATQNNTIVAVVDGQDDPIAGATVQLVGPSGTTTKTTSISTVTQKDWTNGGDQNQIGDWKKFYVSSGIAYSTTDQLTLASTDGIYEAQGQLTSSTIDMGSATTFHELRWTPATQSSGTGSIVRFQLAANNDATTWNFVGPDGTDQTYYTDPISNITPLHTGNRYLRYRVFLSTTDTTKTPLLKEVSILYTASCLPQGQVSFSGLASGTYTMTVSKSGFATVTKTITINGTLYETTTLVP